MGRFSFTRRNTFLGMSAALGLSACQQRLERPFFSADTQPDGYPTVMAVKWMSNYLSKKTNGRLSIRTYPGGQLGEEKDTLEIAIFGGLDMVRVNLAPLASFAPETIVPTLPFLFRSTEHMRASLDKAPGDIILNAFQPHGLIGLCFYDSGARSFYSTKGPIRTPNDLKGQKIRVQNSDMYVAMVEALGGSATPMGLGEVYQALVQGVVDGAENNAPSFVSSRHFETAHFYSLTRHVLAPEVLVMSDRRWRKLSLEDQALVREAAKASVPIMRDLWEQREIEAMETLNKAGTKIIKDIDHEAFVKGVKPVWDRFIKTKTQQDLVDSILAVKA
jgi:tripartite ATP-independent transporter DctP family solute receptor